MALPARKLPHLLVLLILLVPLSGFIYISTTIIFFSMSVACRADSLLLGVLCACLLRNRPSRNWLEANQPRLFKTLYPVFGGRLSDDVAKGKDIFCVAVYLRLHLGLYLAGILLWLPAVNYCNCAPGNDVGIMRLPCCANLEQLRMASFDPRRSWSCTRVDGEGGHP